MDQAALSALSPFAQAGLAGIAVLALIIIMMTVREHRKEMREMSEQNRDMLKDIIDRNTTALTKTAEATSALTASLPNVCRYRNN